MKNILPIFLILAFSSVIAAPVFGTSNNQDSVTYHYELNDEISNSSWHHFKKAVQEANQLNARAFIITLNTYGGSVLAADSIRTLILRSKIPVLVLINNNAASAGALISIACDHIYMLPGSSIGAATVVTEDGAPAIDKYQSYMRSKMRATAEEKGRDPLIAEAMVDQDIAIDGITETGKLLTFTVSEAISNGYCDQEVLDLDQVLEIHDLSPEKIITYTPTTLDSIISFFVNPAISGLLIMLMLGGIYFELQSPGIGFPLGASILACVLYFIPLYAHGLAENWEILIALVGLILLLLEIFVVPGTGITGILGLTFLIGGLVLSQIENIVFDFTFTSFNGIIQALFVVLAGVIGAILSIVFLFPKLISSTAFSKAVLVSEQKVSDGFVGVNNAINALVGKKGMAKSDLKPSGRIIIDGNMYDGLSADGFIEVNTPVVVTSTEGAQLIIRKLN